MYVLDTCVVSELRKSRNKRHKANKGVVNWTKSVNASAMFIASVTLMEIEIGILSMERRDEKQGKALRTWLNETVLTAFQGRIIPFDDVIALRCASLHVPDPKSARDAMIAATALVHKMVVVTRNEKDFIYTQAEVLNPWS